MDGKEVVEMLMGAFEDALEEKVTEQIWSEFVSGNPENEALEATVVERLSELRAMLFGSMPSSDARAITEAIDRAFTDYSIYRQKVCYIAGLMDGRNWRGGNGNGSA